MNTTKLGLYTGLTMSLIMATLSISSDYHVGFVKYLKYVPLALFLCLHAFWIKQDIKPRRFFSYTLSKGLVVSIYAGLMVSATVLLLFAFDPSFAPMKFNLLASNWGQAVTIAAMLLIETIAFGIIINFIVLQALKEHPELSA